jgi:hypothetical protein
VFNTEAHPFLIWGTEAHKKVSRLAGWLAGCWGCHRIQCESCACATTAYRSRIPCIMVSSAVSSAQNQLLALHGPHE